MAAPSVPFPIMDYAKPLEVSRVGQCWYSLLSRSTRQSWSQNRLLSETLAANHGSTFTSLVGLEKHTTYSMHFLNCEVTLGAPTPFKGYSEYKNSNILGEA